MKRAVTLNVITSLLTLLFAYTAFSKLMDQDRFRAVLQHTPFVDFGAAVLAPAVPSAELVIVLLLLFPQTRHWGLVASAGLLSVFTVYLAAMPLSGVKLPCSCGGVISALGWKEHVVMNAVFAGLAVWGARRVRD